MMAPSCRGVLCSKILIRSWLVTIPSTSIPVLSYSVRLWFCSITIRAPVFTLPISTHAFAISLIVLSENLPSGELLPSSKGRIVVKIFFLPSSSMALRSSGCKITTTAVATTLKVFCTIQIIVFISKYAAISMNATITKNPLRTDHAFVFLIHTRI